MEYAVINSGNKAIIHRPVRKESAENFCEAWNQNQSGSQRKAVVLKIKDVKNAFNYSVVD